MPRFAPSITVVAVALALAGCGKAKPDNALDTLDKELVGANGADPALTAALEEQIMVDPTLADRSNRDAVRAADSPTRSGAPGEGGGPAAGAVGAKLMRTPDPVRVAGGAGAATLGARAAEQARRGVASKCDGTVKYSATYAGRMPAEFPVYPRARVSEAAGNDAPGCGMRVVSFASDATLQNVLDYYYTRARRAGFTAEHQLKEGDNVLAGTRGDSAFYLIAKARQGGGTEADLIANGGR